MTTQSTKLETFLQNAGGQIAILRPLFAVNWPTNETSLAQHGQYKTSNNLVVELAQRHQTLLESSLYASGFSAEIRSRAHLYGDVAMLSDVNLKRLDRTHFMQHITKMKSELGHLHEQHQHSQHKLHRQHFEHTQTEALHREESKEALDHDAPTDHKQLVNEDEAQASAMSFYVADQDAELAGDDPPAFPPFVMAEEDERPEPPESKLQENSLDPDALVASAFASRSVEWAPPEPTPPKPEPPKHIDPDYISHPDTLTGTGGMTAAEQRFAGLGESGFVVGQDPNREKRPPEPVRAAPRYTASRPDDFPTPSPYD